MHFMKDSKSLSSNNIKSAYWQIPAAKDSRPVTAFVVLTRGMYQLQPMPFDFHNAPLTWLALIDRVLGHDLEQYISVYLDDQNISISTVCKHQEILEEVFKRLTDARLTLNLCKCKFGKNELKLFWQVVKSAGLTVDPDEVDAVLKIRTPKSVKSWVIMVQMVCPKCFHTRGAIL